LKYNYEELIEKFKDFVQIYPDVNEPKYLPSFNSLGLSGGKSLFVDFNDIIDYDNDLADQFLLNPEFVIPATEDALKGIQTDQGHNPKEFFFRVYNLPKTSQVAIRDIRSEHIGKLIQSNAVAMIVSDPVAEVKVAVFKCEVCGEFISMPQDSDVFKYPIICTSKACNRKGPFQLMKTHSEFIDHQKVEAIERREDLTGTTLPRRLPLHVKYDLVDTIKPGQRIVVVGVLKSIQQMSKTTKSKATTFSKFLEVLYIAPTEEDIENLVPTEDELKVIKSMAEEEGFIENKILKSFAPAIKHNNDIKYGLLISLAGADWIEVGSTTIRGDSHILLVGDPGTAKSQLTRFAVAIIPGGIFTTGKGASGVGLTAVATQVTDGRWEVQAGALPMAHNRVLGLDEMEKMNEDDRKSIHSVMEQGLVDIAKAGIVTSLLARCPIFANANPKDGRYNKFKPFFEQIDLPPTIISRFDLIYLVEDKEDEKTDREIMHHMMMTRREGMEYLNNNQDLLTEDFLAKYIFYVKKHFHPKIPDHIMKVVEDKYVEMRRRGKNGAVKITHRQGQALDRLLCAHARLRQSDTVNEFDVEKVFAIWESSMESARDPETGEIDVDMIMTGKPKSQRDKITIIREIIEQLDRKNNGDGALIKDVYMEAKSQDISDQFARKIIDELKQKGDAYEPKTGITLKLLEG